MRSTPTSRSHLELTWQVDAGIRYQILPKLQFVAGVFEINKPYFNLDQFDLFRLLWHDQQPWCGNSR